MDLSSVTAIGVAAFACFKFVGYLLSFHLIKRFHPQIQASAIVMSVARTVLGMIVGGALYFAWDAARHRFAGFYNFSYEPVPYYLVLVFLRIFVWGAMILLFARMVNLSTGRMALYAFSGVLLSSILDIPAALFTFLVPGGVLFLLMRIRKVIQEHEDSGF